VLSNTVIKKLLGVLMAIGAVGSAFAGPTAQLTGVKPMISAGAPPDSPEARVDSNLASSRFTGVVSLAIQKDNQLFICSGPWSASATW
jgi:hypothetical protein